MKLFLTADNHIGLKYASHAQAAVLAAKRTDAFVSMVHAANEEACGLFVIAGDLFENTYSIARKEIKRLFDILSEFHGTVVILPGNHDYYNKDVKLWQQVSSVMEDYDNIMLITQNRAQLLPVGEEMAVLYPAMCMSHHSAPGENNLAWIDAEAVTADSFYHIGIAHGAVEGQTIDTEGRYFLMTEEELERIPVDVWLIGHTHVPFPRNVTQEEFTRCGKILNAGTHVQTDVACNTEGQCFIVRIDEDKSVWVKKYVSGNVRFYRKLLKVSAGGLEHAVDEAVRDLSEESVVELVLSGTVSVEEYDRRQNIVETALSRFLESTWQDCELSKLITKELIDAEFSETSFSAGLLKALLEDPREAQMAYEILKSLKEGQ